MSTVRSSFAVKFPIPRTSELQRKLPPHQTNHHDFASALFSMARPLILPLQWRQLHQALCPKAHTLGHNGVQACARAVTNSNTTTSKRPFHTTQARSAVGPPRRSPSVRMQERKGTGAVSGDVLVTSNGHGLDRDGFWNRYCVAHVEPTLAEFKEFTRQMYETYDYLLPPGVNMATFGSVGEQLIRLSHSRFPSASLIRSISIGEFQFHSIEYIVEGYGIE